MCILFIFSLPPKTSQYKWQIVQQKLNKELNTTLPDVSVSIFIRKNVVTVKTVEWRYHRKNKQKKTLDIIIL